MSLDEEIKKVQDEVHDLQRLLFEKEKALNELRRKKMLEDAKSLVLDKSDIERYSRQILVPDHGMENQLKLKKTSVLIVGAGGLGCPAAMYLTGAGVGTIGLLDHDVIEITNLHRQLLHNESSLGRSKVDSAINSLSRLNSTTNFIKHETLLTSTNAMDIIKDYDLVLDCTDNVATRYLLNDCCILLKRPLISGSALQMEGQLTVYGYRNGPCYRCIFPVPPPPETVTNCGDGGVIPTVPGVIGVLQAVEAIKLITDKPTLSGRLLLYYAADSAFRNIKLRGKSKDCAVCSENKTITTLIDYEQFCGAKAMDKDPKLKILSNDERVTVIDFNNKQKTTESKHVLIDVRATSEFEMCKIQKSINIPIDDVLQNKQTDLLNNLLNNNDEVYVVCRRGNDSQRAVKHLKRRWMLKFLYTI
ncbi:adenylyltransferase and sulfurtransferase MOCS3-like [Ctenocephalides felis]|uniref:adenylyltransferase and sulfurtransferase MOCS3-like n=1 Tax=Ctenocephalides felis TaxID=7515 RepID=UPI000E6E3C3B|nr:adenylyltransferase and sulfurtransferase MOCS3-like [Ctenocephalides felis]